MHLPSCFTGVLQFFASTVTVASTIDGYSKHASFRVLTLPSLGVFCQFEPLLSVFFVLLFLFFFFVWVYLLFSSLLHFHELFFYPTTSMMRMLHFLSSIEHSLFGQDNFRRKSRCRSHGNHINIPKCASGMGCFGFVAAVIPLSFVRFIYFVVVHSMCWRFPT